MAASNVRITNRRTGEEYLYVRSWSIEQSYFTAADGFDFEIQGYHPASLWLEPITIEVDIGDGLTIVMLHGRIDKVESGSADGVLVCSGRDYIGDLTETHLDPNFSIREGETPDAILLRALKPMGIKEIVGPEGAWFNRTLKTSGKRTGRNPGRATFKADDPLYAELKPKKGVGLWEFCERFATRFGYTLQPTTDPTILSLSRPDYEQAPRYKLQRTLKASNRTNIVAAKATREGTSLPSHIQFAAKTGAFGKSVAGIGKALDVLEASRAINNSLERELWQKLAMEPTEDGLLLYRYRFQEDVEAKTQDQLDFLTQRKLGQFLKDALTYRVNVNGMLAWPTPEYIWGIDTVVDVYDEIAHVYEPMWVETCNYKYDAKSGMTCNMVLWRLGAAVVGDPPPLPYVTKAAREQKKAEDENRYHNPITQMSEKDARAYKWTIPEVDDQRENAEYYRQQNDQGYTKDLSATYDYDPNMVVRR